MASLTYARLRFTTESAEECVRVLRAYKGREEYTPPPNFVATMQFSVIISGSRP